MDDGGFRTLKVVGWDDAARQSIAEDWCKILGLDWESVLSDDFAD